MEAVERDPERPPKAERIRDAPDDVVRVSQVPGEAVEVAEDVARGAGGLAVARRFAGVVEKPAAGRHARRLRIEEGQMGDLQTRARIDDGDRVVEAREGVEPMARLVEHEPGRSAAAHRNVIGRARYERVVLERG